MENGVATFFAYTAPALIVGVIAYYFFYLHTKNEDGRRRYLLLKDNAKEALPYRLQAYERMALFLERINPQKLLLRVTPKSEDKEIYEAILTQHIENEFEHNVSQQIYMSPDLWNVIRATKSATIQIIRKASKNEELKDSKEMSEYILKEFINKPTPSSSAMLHLQNEVREIWKV